CYGPETDADRVRHFCVRNRFGSDSCLSYVDDSERGWFLYVRSSSSIGCNRGHNGVCASNLALGMALGTAGYGVAGDVHAFALPPIACCEFRTDMGCKFDG